MNQFELPNPWPLSVETAIDEYIVSVSKDRPWDGKYHPSSMHGCARQVIYSLRATEQTEQTDTQALRRFYIGNQLHTITQEAIALSPHVQAFYPEFEVDVPEWNITGHGDGLVLFDTDEWAVLELKSARKRAFAYGLKDDHVQQGMTYCWCVREFGCRALNNATGLMEEIPPLGDQLLGTLFVYLEKEDLEVREHWVPWSAEFEGLVEARVDYLDEYRLSPSALPPRLPKDKNGKKHWRCRFCPVMRKCWYEDPDEIRPGGIET